MKIHSNDFKNAGFIKAKHASWDKNVAPHLAWSDLPAQTKSLVLICDDPDAIKPAHKIWVHWLVYDIAPTVHETSDLKDAKQGLNDFGNHGYDGPNPPDGEHRYYFELFALDTAHVDLQQRITRDEFCKRFSKNILDSCIITGRHKK